MSTPNMLEAARLITAGGVSVIPIDDDKRPAHWLLPILMDEHGNPVLNEKGKPKRGWEPFQHRIATDAELVEWFAGPNPAPCIAVVGGKVSGGLEIIDFDVKRFVSPWLEDVEAFANRTVHQKSASGCDHFAYRCDAPLGNTVFASRSIPDPDKPGRFKRETAIETRGEGGYLLVSPSRLSNGGSYEMLRGSFASVPHLPQSIVDLFRQCARDLDEWTDERAAAAEFGAKAATVNSQCRKDSTKYAATNGIIESWTDKNRLADVLRSNGYAIDGSEFKRPGKTDRGMSGHIVTCPDGRERSIHFSTNDELYSDRFGKSTRCGVCDAFDVYVHFRHGGNFKAAIAAAARELGMHYRKDVEVEASVLDSTDAEQYAELFEGNTASVGGDVDAAFDRMAEILRRHSRSEEQITRIISKSKLADFDWSSFPIEGTEATHV